MSISPVGLKDTNRVDLDSNQYTFSVEVLDYIPMVSIVSGVARQALGLLQIVVAPIHDVACFVDSYFRPAQASNDNANDDMNLRGRANILRGSIAMYPVIGNIAVYLCDRKFEKGWENRAARSLRQFFPI